MSYEEIERAYPDEWVLIVDPDDDDGGVVVAHGEDRDELERCLRNARLRSVALYFVPGPREKSRNLAFLL